MSDDRIKRSDAIEAIRKVRPNGVVSYLYADLFITALCRVPSADRPQGEWLPFEFGDERWHKCSCCGTADKYIEYVPRPNGTVGKLVSIRNFCPNCGARMFAKDINVPNTKGADDDIR